MKKILFLVSFICLFFMNAKSLKSQEAPNPFEELVKWTFEQNIGATYLYDLDEKTSKIGGKWNFLTSKHKWLNFGLVASTDPAIGFGFGFNFGKLIEKIKGQPMIYLKYLEVGYYNIWEFNKDKNNTYDGIYLNVIKIEF